MIQERECPDCSAPVDDDGYAIDSGDCGWSHPDDCDTCGAVCCDMSC